MLISSLASSFTAACLSISVSTFVISSVMCAILLAQFFSIVLSFGLSRSVCESSMMAFLLYMFETCSFTSYLSSRPWV